MTTMDQLIRNLNEHAGAVLLRAGLVLAAAVFAAGCGGPKVVPLPDTVPVTGVVTMDGAPLKHASVTFIPGVQTKGIECMGVTDESGRYTLKQIRGKDGAPPGEYRVVIRRPVTEDGSPFLANVGDEKAGEGAPKGVPKESLPARYSSPEGTRLTIVVPPNGGELNFDLKK